jgi:hypothetical protein
MLDRTAAQFDVQPSRLVADAGYGSAEMVGWLVDERGIEPHVKVFDKSERLDGTFCATTSLTTPNATSMFVQAEKSFANAAACSLGRHDRLPRQQTRLRRLRAQVPMLPEHARAQDRALCS